MTIARQLEKQSNRIFKLEAENEALKQRVEYLENMIRPPVDFSAKIGLTRGEDRILALLFNASPRVVSDNSLIAAVYGFDSDGPNSTLSVKVHIHKLRKKLSPFSVSIKNSFGSGYWLPEDSHAALQTLKTGGLASALGCTDKIDALQEGVAP